MERATPKVTSHAGQASRQSPWPAGLRRTGRDDAAAQGRAGLLQQTPEATRSESSKEGM
jgi:hypothetical protein